LLARRDQVFVAEYQPGVTAATVHADVAHVAIGHRQAGGAAQLLQHARVAARDVQARHLLRLIAALLGRLAERSPCGPRPRRIIEERVLLEPPRGRQNSAATALAQRLHQMDRVRRPERARPDRPRERQNAADAECAKAGGRDAARMSDLRLLHGFYRMDD